MFWIINCGIIPIIIEILMCTTVIKDNKDLEDFIGAGWFFCLIIMFFITWGFNISSILSELILIIILIAIPLLPYLCVHLYKRKHATTNKQCPICDKTFTYKFRIEDKQICDSCYKKM